MSGLEIFGWGLFGGFAAEAAVFYAHRHQLPGAFPHWSKSPAYYVIVATMILSGGLLKLAYSRSGRDLDPILAIQIGASTPLILRKLRDILPEMPPVIDPDKID